MPIHSPIPASHWLRQTPIAHRGLHHSSQMPENSLGAFQNALQAGVPIELDIQLLADGQLAVIHDNNLLRVTGQPGNVRTQTAATIRKFHLIGSEETVPLLDDVLTLVNGVVPLLIEIKSTWTKVGFIEETLLSRMKHYKGDFALQSFNPLTLRYLQRHAPNILRGQLSGVSHELHIPSALKFVLLNLPSYCIGKPDFVVHALDSLPHWSTTHLRNSGLPLLTWTVTNAKQVARAKQLADNYIFEQFDCTDSNSTAATQVAVG